MTEGYDGSGDYSAYNNDDEKDYCNQRKNISGASGSNIGTHNGENLNHDHHYQPTNNAGNGILHMIGKANEYIRDCITEKNRMDRKYPIAEKLLVCEIEKVQSSGRMPSRDQKYADIYREKPLRVAQRVLVPIREHPKFNFVGKLLGPKGNSLRRLQEETMCKMTVLGRNSMRDRVKEEELRASKDPKYAHLNSDLHVEISTIAPPAEAYARIAYAMAELRKYLIPDSNDIIRQEQLRELMDNTSLNDSNDGKNAFNRMSYLPTTASSGFGSNGNGSVAESTVVGKNPSHHNYRSQQNHAHTMFSKNRTFPTKQKVMSILEKARTAMDETYSRGYNDSMGYEQRPYDSYGYINAHIPTHGPKGPTIGGVTSNININRGAYDGHEYDTDHSPQNVYEHSPNYTGVAPPRSNQSNAVLNSNHNHSHANR